MLISIHSNKKYSRHAPRCPRRPDPKVSVEDVGAGSGSGHGSDTASQDDRYLSFDFSGQGGPGTFTSGASGMGVFFANIYLSSVWLTENRCIRNAAKCLECPAHLRRITKAETEEQAVKRPKGGLCVIS